MFTDPKQKIIKAYQQLVKNDFYLLAVDVNERSLTHKLAEYLQLEFSEYHVDCEYNREGLHPKRLVTFREDIKSDDTNGVTVFPDIIIHRRGTGDNLVAIEAKKSTSDARDDREKLEAYKNELGYKFAYFVTFPIGNANLEKFTKDFLDGLIEEIDKVN